MNEENIVRIDKILWLIKGSRHGYRHITPLCPKHHLELESIPPKLHIATTIRNGRKEDSKELKCNEGHILKIPRTIELEEEYVIERFDAKTFKKMKVLNLDDEAIPIAESKIKSKDNKYFVTSQLMESKRGIQLVIYAGETGEKGKSEKTQIFVEPEVKRMDFDRNNLRPDEVFVEVTAKFRDGSIYMIKKE